MKHYLTIAVLSTAVLLTGCEKQVSKLDFDLPDRENLVEYSQTLEPVLANHNQELMTTPKLSNVSPNIAIIKMLHAPNLHDADSHEESFINGKYDPKQIFKSLDINGF